MSTENIEHSYPFGLKIGLVVYQTVHRYFDGDSDRTSTMRRPESDNTIWEKGSYTVAKFTITKIKDHVSTNL